MVWHGIGPIIKPMKLKAFVLLLIISHAAFAGLFDRARKLVRSRTATTTDEKFYGVKVMFKNWDTSGQDSIHKELNTKVYFRSIRLRVDVVHLKDVEDNQNVEKLKQLCREYFEQDKVHWCSVNVKPRNLDAEPCLDGIRLFTSPFVSEIETIASAFACSPYPGMTDAEDIESVVGGNRLTHFWAQEAVGSLEAAEEMAQGPIRPVSVGVLDGAFNRNPEAYPAGQMAPELMNCLREGNDNCGAEAASNSHGTKALNLIAGARPVGGSPAATISRLVTNDGKAGYTRGIDQMLGGAANNPPEVVSMSMGVPRADFLSSNGVDEPDVILQSNFETLSNESLLVMAAGNSYPDRVEINQYNHNAIVVGSLMPNGLQSPYSQRDDQVAISAPSGFDIQTISETDRGVGVNTFSGTSAATPVVAAAISNVASYLPGITPDEIKTMLRETGIPTADGSRSLNTFKLVKVAKKLQANWPENRNSIGERGNYNFVDDANENYRQAQSLLREASQCASTDCQEVACDKRKQALKKMRLAFFLNPENEEIRNALGHLYEEAGYGEQARFYYPPEKGIKFPDMREEVITHEMIGAIGRGDFERFREMMNQRPNLLGKGGSDGGGSAANIINILYRTDMDPEVKRQMYRLYMQRLSAEQLNTLSQNRNAHYPLMSLAIQYGQNDKLAQYIGNNFDPNALDIDRNQTLIKDAINYGNADALNLLLDAGARDRDNVGNSIGYHAFEARPLNLAVLCHLSRRNIPYDASSNLAVDAVLQEVQPELVSEFSQLRANNCEN